MDVRTRKTQLYTTYHVNIGEERLITGVLHSASPGLKIVTKMFSTIVDVIVQKFFGQSKQFILTNKKSCLTLNASLYQTTRRESIAWVSTLW